MNSLKERVLQKIKEVVQKYQLLAKTTKNIEDYQKETIKKQIFWMSVKMSSFGQIIRDSELKKEAKKATEILQQLEKEIR